MKSRPLYSKFFTDAFVQGLKAKQKWIYLYYLFNEKVNWLGCYEVTDREVRFGIGDDVNAPELLEAKDLFVISGKILFVDNYVILKNSEKYSTHLGNKQLMPSALKQFNELPLVIKQAMLAFKPEDIKELYLQEFSSLGCSLDSSLLVGYSVAETQTQVIRTNTNTSTREKKEKRFSSITDIDQETIEYIAGYYNYPNKFVEDKLESLRRYCGSKGKRYADYKDTLMNWCRNDWEKEKMKYKASAKVEPVVIEETTQEQLEQRRKNLELARNVLKKIGGGDI